MERRRPGRTLWNAWPFFKYARSHLFWRPLVPDAESPGDLGPCPASYSEKQPPSGSQGFQEVGEPHFTNLLGFPLHHKWTTILWVRLWNVPLQPDGWDIPAALNAANSWANTSCDRAKTSFDRASRPQAGTSSSLEAPVWDFRTQQTRVAGSAGIWAAVGVLAWRIPGTGKPGELPSMGAHRVRHDWSNLAAAAAAGVLTRQLVLPPGGGTAPSLLLLSTLFLEQLRLRLFSRVS